MREFMASGWRWVYSMKSEDVILRAQLVFRVHELTIELMDEEDKPGIDITAIRIGQEELMPGMIIPSRAFPMDIKGTLQCAQDFLVRFVNLRPYPARVRFVIRGSRIS